MSAQATSPEEFVDLPPETEMVNISPREMKFEVDGVLIRMKPSETRKFNTKYCVPRRLREGGDPVDGVIPMLTGGNVVPVTHEKARSHMLRLEAERKSGGKN